MIHKLIPLKSSVPRVPWTWSNVSHSSCHQTILPHFVHFINLPGKYLKIPQEVQPLVTWEINTRTWFDNFKAFLSKKQLPVIGILLLYWAEGHLALPIFKKIFFKLINICDGTSFLHMVVCLLLKQRVGSCRKCKYNGEYWAGSGSLVEEAPCNVHCETRTKYASALCRYFIL